MPPFLYRCPDTGDNVQAWAEIIVIGLIIRR
jgi:hypothetical protein